MVSKTTVVKNPSGIHARPASLFVQEASKYESSITVGKVGGDAKDAKSILMVMSLGMACGCEIEIAADVFLGASGVGWPQIDGPAGACRWAPCFREVNDGGKKRRC